MPKDDIIASSPIVQGDGQMAHRIVIRNVGQKFVVHTQIFDGEKSFFHHGDYFPTRGDADALKKARERFEVRARVILQMVDLSNRFTQVANIAETIINYLMGDDEEHRRDEFENDYQLDSDVETLESLTSKKIRPTHTAS
jgi:hypothetical protein